MCIYPLDLSERAFAGLFRVIAWVLNGLELDVHNATLETDAHGTVCNMSSSSTELCASELKLLNCASVT